VTGAATRTRVERSSVASSSVGRRRVVTAVRSSRVVVDTESDVNLITPATDAPVSSSTAARNRKTARMCAPTLPAADSTAQSSVSPTMPPRALTQSPSHHPGRSPPGPTVPAESPRVTAPNRQIPPDRNGRTAGSTGRSIRIAPVPASATGTR
jgi:hypothetical protein